MDRGRRALIIYCVLFWADNFAAQAEPGSFVYRQGAQLHLDGQPWYFLGANAYWLPDFAKSGSTGTVDSFFQACADYGLKVIRIWLFSHQSPSAWGVYDEFEMRAFDYVVTSAGKHNVRLVMALGNTWTAYRSPEAYMRMAGDDPAGKDILDFYKSGPTRNLYKGHMQYMTNRQNTLTGLRYRDDPTIMMWDVLNEPRCPGCQEAWQQEIVQGWLQDMAGTLKGYAPKQLVAAGTEGFFMDDANMGWNPGAGAMCEGEDWVAITSLSELDCGTVHVYDRQMEKMHTVSAYPTFQDLLNWFQNYLQKHVDVANSMAKPFIVEEFNVIFPKYDATQRAQVFQLVYDFLLYQKSVGGPLMGAMFWNAAIGGSVADDGYNLYLDGNPVKGRRLQQTRAPIRPNTEGLDAFRRGPQREACALAANDWWRPLWREDGASVVDASDLQSRTQSSSTQNIIKTTASQL